MNKEIRVTIGVEAAHFAPLLNDPNNVNPRDTSALPPEYGEIVPLPGLRQVNVTRNDQQVTVYADNRAVIVATSKGEKSVNTEKTSFTEDERVLLFGLERNQEGVVIEGANSLPRTGAFGFKRRFKTETGIAYEFVWHLKGSFAMQSENASTQETTLSPQYQQANGTFLTRSCDKQMTIQKTASDPAEIEMLNETWFDLERLNRIYLADLSGISGTSAIMPVTVNFETPEVKAANVAVQKAIEAARKADENVKVAAKNAELIESRAIAAAQLDAIDMQLREKNMEVNQ
jgi:phi13 family phage major tail protein